MVHPNYHGTPYFDVAVLVAETELTLVNRIRPICLPFMPTVQNSFPYIQSDDEEISDNTPFEGTRSVI